MLTNAKISDGRDVVLDIEPMSESQQKALCAGIADFLIRSGQIRDDVALNPAQLLQFLSEAGDMAVQQAEPVDPESITVFEAKTNQGVLRGDDHYISSPDDFLTKRTLDGTFDDGCNALRTLEEAVENDQDLAEAAALLLNRAFWLGQGRCAPFHVEPRG
jgi:hypothetical protein